MIKRSLAKPHNVPTTFAFIFKMFAAIIDEVFGMYVRALRRPFFLTITVGYLVFAMVFVFRPTLTKAWEGLIDRGRGDDRIKLLETMLEEQRKIAETLTSREKKTSFLRKLEFQEEWKNDHNREEVLRLLEFADFAIQKDDYLRAKRLYEEAVLVQETRSVRYYLGRLAYLQGDLSETESNWRQLIKADAQVRYPEVRLYLGVALYEMGREREGKEVLKDYLSDLTRPL